jgi:hypothetical protein
LERNSATSREELGKESAKKRWNEAKTKMQAVENKAQSTNVPIGSDSPDLKRHARAIRDREADREAEAEAKQQPSAPPPDTAWTDGPDPTEAVAAAVDECLALWPTACARQFVIHDAEREAAKFDPVEWAGKLPSRARIWASHYRQKKAQDPKTRIPGLGFWIGDGQYSREPPRDYQTLEESVAADVARIKAKRGEV